MNRIHTLAVTAVCLAAALLCVSCDGDTGSERLVGAQRVLHLFEHEPEASGAWRRQRVGLGRPGDYTEGRERAEFLALRKAPTVVLLDERDAFYAMGGTTLAFAIPDRAGTFEVDIGLSAEDGHDIAEAEMGFDVALAGERVALAREKLAWVRDAPSAWVRLRIPIPERASSAPAPRRLELRTSLLGVRAEPEADPASLASRVGGAWANPCVIYGDADGDARRADPPNVIVISIDTLRADHLGAYGYERDTSPVLDRLLARGALFEDALSPAPWTLPSYGSFFTGRFPSEHRAGVKPVREATWGSAQCGVAFPPDDTANKQAEVLAADTVTMAEAFAAQGYRTAGFVNNPFLHPGRKVDAGFQQYAWYQPRADGGVALAAAWIERERDRPFFLFLHLMDPHMPYTPPEPWATKFTDARIEVTADYPFTLGHVKLSPEPRKHADMLVDLYDGEIAYTDHCLERLIALLDETGLFDNTIVVVHSDHGEEFWEHGGFEHGHALNRELLHVPLGIVWPGHVPPVRVKERVRTVDVFPTLLELVGLPPSVAALDRSPAPDLAARSLLPHVEAARAGKSLAARDALAEALLYGPLETDMAPWNEAKAGWRAELEVVVGGARGSERLYDVALDPRERDDLARARPDDTLRMRGLLEGWHAALEAAAHSSGGATMTPEQRAAMESLGYAGDDAPVEDGNAPEVDPPPAQPNEEGPLSSRVGWIVGVAVLALAVVLAAFVRRVGGDGGR